MDKLDKLIESVDDPTKTGDEPLVPDVPVVPEVPLVPVVPDVPVVPLVPLVPVVPLVPEVPLVPASPLSPVLAKVNTQSSPFVNGVLPDSSKGDMVTLKYPSFSCVTLPIVNNKKDEVSNNFVTLR